MENAELLEVNGAYQKGLETLGRLLMLELPKLALEMGIAEHSQMVKKYYNQKAGFPKSEEGPILVVQADGKGVPLVRQEVEKLKVRRKKGDKKTAKKEAIATAIYTIEAYPRTPEVVTQSLFKKGEPPAGRPTPCHKQVFATLKGKEKAIRELAKRAARRRGKHILECIALSDGSEPLQNRILAKLPGFVLILDIVHAVEYLWKAGTALYGETDPQRAVWVEAQTLDLLSSRTNLVIQRLEEKAAPLSHQSGHQNLVPGRQLLPPQPALHGLRRVPAPRLAHRHRRHRRRLSPSGPRPLDLSDMLWTVKALKYCSLCAQSTRMMIGMTSILSVVLTS